MLQVLAGLPDSYSAVTEAIESGNMKLHEIISRLEGTEARINRNRAEAQVEKKSGANALLTTTRVPTGPTCHRCGGSGHLARDCATGRNPNGGGIGGGEVNRATGELTCYTCGKTGHIARKGPTVAVNGGANYAKATALVAHEDTWHESSASNCTFADLAGLKAARDSASAALRDWPRSVAPDSWYVGAALLMC